MHPIKLRVQARALYATGMSLRAIGRALYVPYHTIRYWCVETKTPDSHWSNVRICPRCQDPPTTPTNVKLYNYLLGQYLGDGHLVTTARVPVLRIACTDSYPMIKTACEAAMRLTLARSVHRAPSIGCSYVQSYSTHWPCLFPQAGPGRKHERKIELVDWQLELVKQLPGPFVRGLFHSDGCRATNNVTVRGKAYSYPRYFFNNESKDILELCGMALDLLGAEWRYNKRNSISVAKRASVALLEEHVGEKY